MQGRWTNTQISRRTTRHNDMLWKVGDSLTHLVFFQTVLEDVLDDEATGLAQGHFMPHAAQSLIDIFHNLWW